MEIKLPLTAVQQDYIETIYRLSKDSKKKKIRITDIAEKLGTKLPTVTRTVKKLSELGYVTHQSHGGVLLTPKGQKIASELAHLHNDLFLFFTQILGMTKKQAMIDACQAEHAFSSLSAQKLHEFLIYYQNLSENEKDIFSRFKQIKNKKNEFKNLPPNQTSGWRA